MNLSVTIEEALMKASPSLRQKIEWSVDLLRKAEKIALKYDAVDGYHLAFSCGKDSQALFHVAQLAGVKFKGHYSPTTVDPPQVIKFCKRYYPEVNIIKPTISIYNMAIKKGILPMRVARWCCQVYKEGHGAGKVTLTGVRKAESVNRSKRESVEVTRMKYRGDLEGFSSFQEEAYAKLKAKHTNLNQDQFSEAKENEIRCISGKDSIIVNPIIHWTDKDVWEFLNDVICVPHLELYDPPYNQHRVGCILCPMLSYKSAIRDCELYPHVKELWIKTIMKMRANGKYTNYNWGGKTSVKKRNSYLTIGSRVRSLKPGMPNDTLQDYSIYKINQ